MQGKISAHYSIGKDPLKYKQGNESLEYFFRVLVKIMRLDICYTAHASSQYRTSQPNLTAYYVLTHVWDRELVYLSFLFKEHCISCLPF